ncbi:cation:proton antiporter subunit C [Corynebacterium falsenii]|uniref:cation:proton antiporter subunit C n=1 Tax=Corynebacterium falsenii TaxID=108486 RepID=UPI00234E1914|nr:cation:proton antiporter subunit C [Corynebacterium falsenii]MDC7104058.1 cation:proton antiporter subunit C [Corynebacterium falsenii]
MIIAATIAILVAGGTYLVLQRGMLRLIMGIALLTHAVNLLILATGIGAWRTEPIMNRANAGEAADPLPQAFVLTAIVISMAATAVMLAMAALGRDDDTRGTDDPEAASRKFRALQTMGAGRLRPGNEDPVRPPILGANNYQAVHNCDGNPHMLGEDEGSGKAGQERKEHKGRKGRKAAKADTTDATDTTDKADKNNEKGAEK